MRLDKRHLAGALTLLAGSVVYNVWVLAEPGSAGGSVAAAIVIPASSPRAAAATGEPPAVRALPSGRAADVMLDRPPEWARDPFSGAAESREADRPAEPLPAAEAVAPAAEPELALTSVLYSSSRRLAMVNGRIVGVGDTVDGVTIVDILPSAIVVRSPAGGVRTIDRLGAGASRRHP